MALTQYRPFGALAGVRYAAFDGTLPTSASATLAVGYPIRSAGSSTISAGYAIRSASLATLAAGYEIEAAAGTGSATIAVGYAITTASQATLAAGFAIRAAGSSTLPTGYVVRSAGASTLAAGYAVTGRGFAVLAAGYRIGSGDVQYADQPETASSWSYLQTATWWQLTSRDDWTGVKVWAAPQWFLCDYSEEAKRMVNGLGIEFTTRSLMYTSLPGISQGDMVLIGAASGADPVAAGAHEVKAVALWADTFTAEGLEDYRVAT